MSALARAFADADPKLVEAAPYLLSSLESVTRCLAWHIQQGHGVAMDQSVLDIAIATIEEAKGH